tara:strand:- start:186 stop:665 length:480 start_codon:yes stop_codon:yes gene_type:complete
MFDNITVPKTYLKSLLTKDQEKLINRNDFQTKSLDNSLGHYKIYKQYLFLKKSQKQWEKISYNGKVTFYTLFREESDVSYWAVFTFTFTGGKIDRKELMTFETHQQEQEKEIQEWIKKKQAFKNTFKYKFFRKLLGFLTRLHNWASNRTILIHPKYDKD